VKADGTQADIDEGGQLVIKKPWPGMMRTVYGNHQRFIEKYFAQFPGLYQTGDSARKDEDGYFWIMEGSTMSSRFQGTGSGLRKSRALLFPTIVWLKRL